ncbi:metal-binding protein [Oscillatoriales cyanobacterium USR001]|nr:metal-binding protein [Oscillatoriales cyanobacterium USR001]
MPSGRTHDSITLWTLPFVAGLTFGQTQSGNLTLLVSGGFLFGGLMFGPDLDIYSCQYQRWGWLRWLWLPYQKSLRHRSWLSHGPLIGSALRILYLGIWIVVLGIVGVTIAKLFWGLEWNWHNFVKLILRSLSKYYNECFALYIGLELGAMSHSLSDWTGSAYKRFKKQGWQGLLSPATNNKKRQRKSPIYRPKKSKF